MRSCIACLRSACSTAAAQNGLREGTAAGSPTVRRQYCSALGQLAKIAQRTQLQKLLEWTRDLYEAGGAGRHTAALLCLELVRAASEAITPFHVDLLPLVFVGAHDAEKEVATAFNDCWEDAVPARASGVALWAKEILVRVFALLESDDYVNKRVSLATLDEMLSLCGRQGSFATPHGRVRVPGPRVDGRVARAARAASRVVRARAVFGAGARAHLYAAAGRARGGSAPRAARAIHRRRRQRGCARDRVRGDGRVRATPSTSRYVWPRRPRCAPWSWRATAACAASTRCRS